MSRNVSLNHYRFVVSDDPEGVIGTVLDVVTNNVNRSQIVERLAPDGAGYHIDTLGSVHRMESREDLPEPWDQDAVLDPETQELWALYRDPDPPEVTYRCAYVLTGDELRSLVAQAKDLLDAHDSGAKPLGARDRPGD